jgi:hypothetical protein
MPEDVDFLRAQADKCRWLAARIATKDVAQTLLQMAQEYDERAVRIAAEHDRGAAEAGGEG